MAFDKHVRRGHPIVLSLLVFFGIIELAISAWLTSRFNKFHDNSSSTEKTRVEYTLFASCWTVVTSLFFGLLFFQSPTGALTSILVHIVWLVLSWIIWTAAAAAITQMLGGGMSNPFSLQLSIHLTQTF